MKQRKRRTITIDGTYDIECASWDRPVVAVTLHREHGPEIHRSIEAMVDRMLSLGGHWWSHNGGRYDDLAVAEDMRRRGLSMQFSLSGSRISRAVGHGLTLHDSYSLIPLGLERAAELCNRKASPLDWPCQCGRSCGGYCSITVTLTESQIADLARYCVNDCEVLFESLEAIVAFAERHDFDLRGTIGGSSWATAQRWLGIPDADFPSGAWRRMRSAYYGGRVSAFRPRVATGRHWDITSAYPAALSRAMLPVGERYEYGARAVRVHNRRARYARPTVAVAVRWWNGVSHRSRERCVDSA
jgi:hypothetical protein